MQILSHLRYCHRINCQCHLLYWYDVAFKYIIKYFQKKLLRMENDKNKILLLYLQLSSIHPSIALIFVHLTAYCRMLYCFLSEKPVFIGLELLLCFFYSSFSFLFCSTNTETTKIEYKILNFVYFIALYYIFSHCKWY